MGNTKFRIVINFRKDGGRRVEYGEGNIRSFN